MEEIWWYAIAAVAVVVVVILIVLRRKGEIAAGSESRQLSYGMETADAVYEWTASTGLSGQVVFVIIIGAAALAVWALESGFDFGEDLAGLIFPAVFMIFGLLATMFAKRTYTMTNDGLYVRDASSATAEPKPLFSWEDLSWFRPVSGGFVYYLKAKGSEDWVNYRGGRVHCGDSATLVNSLIMARGISTSSPSSS